MKKVLIIDDDEAILEVVKIILTEAGYEVMINRSGDFFNRKPKKLPGIVLLDLLLSGREGTEICKQIKSNPKTSSIPVILMSAYTSGEIEQATKDSKADGFIMKPFEIDDLKAVISKHIK